MRKKSHISLARHIVNVADMNSFQKHKKAFYVGSILPDCKPSFLTKRHEINQTLDILENKMYKLTNGYKHVGDMSTLYFTRLGEVLHYIADYFTYPHNKEYPGNMKDHCIYEGELKHKLRAYIAKLNEQDIEKWKKNMNLADLSGFSSVSDIMDFVKAEHRNYIRREIHTVEQDCRYIVGICSKVSMALLHICNAYG
ncbi:MAG: hypothetical protein E7271_07840 [Lachnospiraceae bacterium]|nr:hypothetical protein [Lachnospiraceae bacterium]